MVEMRREVIAKKRVLVENIILVGDHFLSDSVVYIVRRDRGCSG